MEPPTTIPSSPAFEMSGKPWERINISAGKAMIKISKSPNPDHSPRRIEMQAIKELTSFRRAIRSQKPGATNFPISAGNMIPIMFKRVEALPLRWRRILRSRISRGENAECPRDGCGSWPRTRRIHDLESVANKARTQTGHVHELSVSTFSPRQRSCPWTFPLRVQATTSIGHGQAAVVETERPTTVRSRGLSTAANSSRTRSVLNHGPAKNCPASLPHGVHRISKSYPNHSVP